MFNFLHLFVVARCRRASRLSWHKSGAGPGKHSATESILNTDEIAYGKYAVPGHGMVTLDRKKGRQFIGNKSHMRKPSAYKGKTNRVCAI